MNVENQLQLNKNSFLGFPFQLEIVSQPYAVVEIVVW